MLLATRVVPWDWQMTTADPLVHRGSHGATVDAEPMARYPCPGSPRLPYTLPGVPSGRHAVRGRSSMAEPQPSKLMTGVRIPSAALVLSQVSGLVR